MRSYRQLAPRRDVLPRMTAGDVLRAGVLAAVVAGAGPIVAQQPDIISTVGQDDRQAVGNARRWYDAHSTAVKTRANDCLATLEEAKALQDTALDLYAQAREPGNKNASELVKQANAMIALRTEKLEAFKDCVNAAIQAEQMATEGSKAIKRAPSPSRPSPAKPGPPRSATLEKIVDDCFASKVPGYESPDWTLLGLKDVKPATLDPFAQAFALTGVAADRALDLDAAKYGKWIDRGLGRDYLIGWATRCLWDRERVPQTDPRIDFKRLVNEGPDRADAPRRADREEYLQYGWSTYPLPPFPDRSRRPPVSGRGAPSGR